MSIKYTHSKTPNSHKVKVYRSSTPSPHVPRGLRERLSRKASNHVSFEAIYGEQYPKGGGSLGVTYDKTTGIIEKAHRADSVE